MAGGDHDVRTNQGADDEADDRADTRNERKYAGYRSDHQRYRKKGQRRDQDGNDVCFGNAQHLANPEAGRKFVVPDILDDDRRRDEEERDGEDERQATNQPKGRPYAGPSQVRSLIGQKTESGRRCAANTEQQPEWQGINKLRNPDDNPVLEQIAPVIPLRHRQLLVMEHLSGDGNHVPDQKENGQDQESEKGDHRADDQLGDPILVLGDKGKSASVIHGFLQTILKYGLGQATRTGEGPTTGEHGHCIERISFRQGLPGAEGAC